MHAIWNWMKEFLILYLLLTILMHLAAAEEYKKYLRFLSGLILLLVLISPVMQLFGGDSKQKLLQSYDTFWEKMDAFPSDMRQAELQQSTRSLQKYEKAVATEMIEQARAQGILTDSISVSLSEDYEIDSVAVWLDIQQKQEVPSVKERMLALLQDRWRLEERQIFISYTDGQ